MDFKMSAKLIVHKFEDGISNKSLLVTIAEKDNDQSETKFGEWLEGRTLLKKKDIEQSSRLVVKIVTGSEFAHLNLDSCAKLIDNLEFNTLQKLPIYNYSQSITRNESIISCNSETHSNSVVDNKDNTYFSCHKKSDTDWWLVNQFSSNNEVLNFYNGFNKESATAEYTSCPLEYSLEKVKENNARIMENIHMLNRTLNYTKKKEILDIACPKSMRSFPCETCGKCFVYETGLKRHYTMRHAITETPQRWQVVWTCTECFQVWPQQDLAYDHSKQCSRTDNIDNIREIKTSSLLQCEFCEKVFTSIPRLVWHSKKHSTQKNYECNTCETSYSSFRAAEEHWQMCPWLKAYYSFSLPKHLLCNACDRKFRNYEQLYTHRYKIGHFMAKTHISTDTFAYQCEVCAECFPAIPLLQVHKQQCHPLPDMTTSMVITNYSEFDSNYYSPSIDSHT